MLRAGSNQEYEQKILQLSKETQLWVMIGYNANGTVNVTFDCFEFEGYSSLRQIYKELVEMGKEGYFD